MLGSELIIPCYYLKIAIGGLIDGHSNGSIFLISKPFIDIKAFLLAVAISVEVAIKWIILVDGLGCIVDNPPVNYFTIVIKTTWSALGFKGEAQQCEKDQIFH